MKRDEIPMKFHADEKWNIIFYRISTIFQSHPLSPQQISAALIRNFKMWLVLFFLFFKISKSRFWVNNVSVRFKHEEKLRRQKQFIRNFIYLSFMKFCISETVAGKSIYFASAFNLPIGKMRAIYAIAEPYVMKELWTPPVFIGNEYLK